MTVRLKAAAFQNRIQDADCGGRFELELLSGFIIIYQERTVNDVENGGSVAAGIPENKKQRHSNESRCAKADKLPLGQVECDL